MALNPSLNKRKAGILEAGTFILGKEKMSKEVSKMELWLTNTRGGLDATFHHKWLKIWLENICSCGEQQHQRVKMKVKHSALNSVYKASIISKTEGYIIQHSFIQISSVPLIKSLDIH